MTDEEQSNQMKQHVRDALRKIDGARWYAVDEAALDSLVMLGNAWLEDRHEKGEKFSLAEFQALIETVVANVDSLRQIRPGEPPATPEVWKDPVTGLAAKNPWSDPPDLTSQGVLEKSEPLLAEHLRRTKDGTSYAVLSELKEREARRARLASIKYGPNEHASNPWRNGDLAARAAVTRRDQDLADVMKREAEPVTLPWAPGSENLSGKGQLDKVPGLLKLAHRARELQWQRAAEADLRIKSEIEALKRQQAEQEKMLHGK